MTRLALDPGTANTLIYVKGRGLAVNERSLVTVSAPSGHIESVGGAAEAGLGRTPRRLRTVRPLRAGTITDLGLFDGMLHRFLASARIRRPWPRFQAAIAIPGGTTEVERRALIQSLHNAGASQVFLVDQVLAAARGAGLPIEESRGRMIVNIGAGVTDAAVLSLGSIVHARATRTAGDDLDAAIAAWVRAEHHLLIGELTAERLKLSLASAAPLLIKGRCIRHGVPREAVIPASALHAALEPTLHRILACIRQVLEQAPPELSADLVDTGITLTGGSALLPHLDRLIARDTGLPVTVAPHPLSSVIHGLAWQLHHLHSRDWRRFSAR